MPKLHISQDDTGYWQLSLEDDDGKLSLLSHQFPSPDHLIEDARELVADGKVPGGVIIIGPPEPQDVAARDAQKPYKARAAEGIEVVAGIFWFADGVGRVEATSTALIRWIRSQAPDLVVYGGDVYNDGKPDEIRPFLRSDGPQRRGSLRSRRQSRLEYPFRR